MTTPRVFISYAWEGPTHRAWVRDFATRLREDGVNAIMDIWEAAPGDSLPAFMETQVRESDFVLVLCTPKYKAKSDSRLGGVGYEGDVMTGEVFTGASRRKFIPVLCAGNWTEAAPGWLVSTYYVDLSVDPIDRSAYQNLLRTLLSQRETAPPIGQVAETISTTARKVPALLVGMDGRFVGGIDAVRRAALALMDSTWDGDLALRCKAIEAIQTELTELESLGVCSPEQGERIVGLRARLGFGRLTMLRVSTALRSTFLQAPARERTWGAHMTLEDATIFIESLFVHARLAALKDGDWTECWICLPAFRKHRLMTQFLLPQAAKREASDQWRTALMRHPRLTSQWTDVLPVLAFHNTRIAQFLLPAIVFQLVQSVTFEKGASAAAFWSKLAELNSPEDNLDPLNPLDWCVAVSSDIDEEDLKWNLSAPPKSIADLDDYVRKFQTRRDL